MWHMFRGQVTRSSASASTTNDGAAKAGTTAVGINTITSTGTTSGVTSTSTGSISGSGATANKSGSTQGGSKSQSSSCPPK